MSMPNWSAAKTAPKKAIPYSTTDYLELVDWSSRSIIEGKKGSIPDHLPPILQRLSINPGQYLNFIRKPGSGLLTVLGALDRQDQGMCRLLSKSLPERPDQSGRAVLARPVVPEPSDMKNLALPPGLACVEFKIHESRCRKS